MRREEWEVRSRGENRRREGGGLGSKPRWGGTPWEEMAKRKYREDGMAGVRSLSVCVCVGVVCVVVVETSRTQGRD